MIGIFNNVLMRKVNQSYFPTVFEKDKTFQLKIAGQSSRENTLSSEIFFFFTETPTSFYLNSSLHTRTRA